MYILLKKGKLRKIMQEAIKKSGSQKNFSGDLQIPKSKAWSYQKYNIALKKERLDKILAHINKKIQKEDIEKELPNNWRQTIGGKNCVKKKLKEGTLNKQLACSRKNIKKTLSDWHKEMRKKNIKAYYLSQYDKFKKVAGYKFMTENGEKVRNKFEKEVADVLKQLGITYAYEPLVKLGNNYFFPDFLINDKIIIECTMWRGYDKAIKLKEKINILEKKFKIYVVIPEKLSKYYQSISGNLIYGLNGFRSIISNF